jgi:hypothetical protein
MRSQTTQAIIGGWTIMTTIKIGMALLMMTLAFEGQAAVYKCVDAAGKVTYSDYDCNARRHDGASDPSVVPAKKPKKSVERPPDKLSESAGKHTPTVEIKDIETGPAPERKPGLWTRIKSWFARPAKQKPNDPAPVAPAPETPKYACQGKTRCTEMTSCEEALFYRQYCPGVMIDGDADGIPCESQWCN